MNNDHVGKIAILSDIHGNSPALRAVLDDISKKGCSRIFVLGDVINGIDPRTCIKLLQEHENIFCLKGNAEFYVLTPDLEDFPRKRETIYRDLIPLIQWFQSHLSTQDLEWLQKLPDLMMWNQACFVHDSPLDRLFSHTRTIPGIPEKYQEFCFHSKGISTDTPEEEWDSLWRWMDERSLSHIFCAHTHIPFYRNKGEKLVCNVGSVGLPLDGDPRSAWVMLENEPGKESLLTIHRVAYDIEQMLHMVDEASNYPDFKTISDRQAYKKTLETGLFQR